MIRCLVVKPDRLRERKEEEKLKQFKMKREIKKTVTKIDQVRESDMLREKEITKEREKNKEREKHEN